MSRWRRLPLANPLYADIADYDEDKRIEIIAHRVIDHKEIVSFIVDDEPDKAGAGTFSKLQTLNPLIRVIDRGKGPVKDTQWVKVGPPTN